MFPPLPRSQRRRIKPPPISCVAANLRTTRAANPGSGCIGRMRWKWSGREEGQPRKVGKSRFCKGGGSGEEGRRRRDRRATETRRRGSSETRRLPPLPAPRTIQAALESLDEQMREERRWFLKGLVVEAGKRAVLVPPFSPGVFQYTVS